MFDSSFHNHFYPPPPPALSPPLLPPKPETKITKTKQNETNRHKHIEKGEIQTLFSVCLVCTDVLLFWSGRIIIIKKYYHFTYRQYCIKQIGMAAISIWRPTIWSGTCCRRSKIRFVCLWGPVYDISEQETNRRMACRPGSCS